MGPYKIQISIVVNIGSCQSTTDGRVVKERAIRLEMAQRFTRFVLQVGGQQLHLALVRVVVNVTAGKDNVFISIGIEICSNGAKGNKLQVRPIESYLATGVSEHIRSFIEVQCHLLIFEIGNKQIKLAIQIKIEQRDSHASIGNSIVIDCNAGRKCMFLEAIATSSKQKIGEQVIGNIQPNSLVPTELCCQDP